MLANILRRMTRPQTLQRTRLIAQHMSSSSSLPGQQPAATVTEPTVLFESNGSVRRYILNRPKKLNALDESMINALRPKIQEWEDSELCRIIVGDGAGKAFCAGGDVQSVVKNGANPKTRHMAINFFKLEFELDYQLASLRKPYVVVCDGHTMGGGVGLSAHAPFRIATENTLFAMPETNIGYCPDVGANYFLPRLDGEIGTYLALTSFTLAGRAVFENGLATHFVPSRRIPQLLAQLAALEDPTLTKINATIEEQFDEPLEGETTNSIVGEIRVAVDTVFGQNSVEKIITSLEGLENSNTGAVGNWAKETLLMMKNRSPTSLKVALEAIRRGRKSTLAQALRMELGIATAFLTGASSDFQTGVTAVLIDRIRGARPAWTPGSLEDVSPDIVKNFFDSKYTSEAPKLDLSDELTRNMADPSKFSLPTELEIEQVVRGMHPQSGAVAYNLENLTEKFQSMTGHKSGVEAKIREVVARRCEVVEDPDNHHCLRWK